MKLHLYIDTSELENGPEIIALKGDENENNEFKLGNREYASHAHQRGQLFCVESGFVQVDTKHASWVLPSLRACWIPPRTQHQIKIHNVKSGYTIFVRPDQCVNLPAQPCVIHFNEILRVLTQTAAQWPLIMELDYERKCIAAVIMNEVRLAPLEPLSIPIPQNERLKKVSQNILDNLHHKISIKEIAKQYAMSESTLRRLFLKDTGINIYQWIQQVKLSRACELLAMNQISLNEISDQLGYSSTSNFITMFKKAFGYPPKQYFSHINQTK